MYKNHIAQYNDFLSSLPSILADIPPLVIDNHKLTIKELQFDKPYEINDSKIRKILPSDCIASISSYRAKCTIVIDLNGKEERIPAGLFPVMVGSKLCHKEDKKLETGYDYVIPYDRNQNSTETKQINSNQATEKCGTIDQKVLSEVSTVFDSFIDPAPSHPTIVEPSGGYFIINGQEKVIRFLVSTKRHVPLLIHRPSLTSKHRSFTARAVQFRSVRNERAYNFFFHLCKDKNVMVRMIVKRKEYTVPAIKLLKALKNVTDDEIISDLGTAGRFLIHSYNPSTSKTSEEIKIELQNQKEAMEYLNTLFSSLSIESIDNYIFPHLESLQQKYDCMILCIRTLLYSDQIDDIDTTANQEISSVRQVLSVLLYDKLTEALNVVKRTLGIPQNVTSQAESDESEDSSAINDFHGNSDKKAKSEADQHENEQYDVEKQDDKSESDSSEDKGFEQGAYGDDSSILSEHSPSKSKKVKKPLSKQKAISKPKQSQTNIKRKRVISSSDILKRLKFSFCPRIEHLLSTGNYSFVNTSDQLQTSGLSITADRINLFRFLSHFESVNRGAFFAQLKTTTVRMLRPESLGFLCPVHTPDGAPCGLITHLAMGASVSREVQVDLPLPIVKAKSFNSKDSGFSSQETKVLVKDGKILGIVDLSYHNFLLKYKTKFNLAIEVVNRTEAIYVFTQAGRLMRQVVDFKKNQLWIGAMEQTYCIVLHGDENTEFEKISERILPNDTEKIDKNTFQNPNLSQNNVSNNIAGSGKPNSSIVYQNISPHLIFSYVAGTIPLSEYNQSPRNMYQCQMVKQAMSNTTLNDLTYTTRSDNKSFSLTYMQSPLVTTDLSPLIGLNVHIAVLCYTSYDMDDAMVLNKNSVQRGLFDGAVYKTLVIEYSNQLEVEIAVQIGDTLKQGDLIYRQKTANISNETNPYKDTRYKDSEPATVHTLRITPHHHLMILRIRRSPEIGDKFCSRHGQKGVMSYQMRCTDLPFSTTTGLIPDLIINPHAFPSRMTIGMMMEILMAQICVLTGKRVRCPSFHRIRDFASDDSSQSDGKEKNRKNLYDNLKICMKLLGLNSHGNDQLISGTTGRPLRTQTFTGLCYYQRLRHMVSDKWQVRSTGLIDVKTRQPIKGRKRGGGVRFGEMEKNALIAHGTSHLLNDRLVECSDKAIFEYCKECKSFLFVRNRTCICGSKDLCLIVAPYVLKYLLSELMAMNIFVEVDVE